MGETTVLSGEDMRRMLVRISHEVVERAGDEPLAIVGIHRRGVPLATRLHELVQARLGGDVQLGAVDIAPYRDDADQREQRPDADATRLPFALEGRTVILVDDVLFTGRTMRAAIDALFAHGRPARVQLAVLVDRGHRELPIRPDFVGKNLPTAREERVNVLVDPIDGVDAVAIARRVPEVTS